MFLVAVSRPRWNHSQVEHVDSKLRIWPFVFPEPAKRSSSSRPNGTMETIKLF